MQSLKKRINTLRKLRRQFGVKAELLAEKSGIHVSNISKVLAETDDTQTQERYDKYYTTGNVAALESGLLKVLRDYRSRLDDAITLLESQQESEV